MESSGIYITFNVAAADAGTIVVQAFLHGDRILSSTFPLAEVAACGAKDAPRMVGCLLLAALSEGGAALQRYPRLIGMRPPRQFEHATMDAPPTRPAHLRARFAIDPDRLLLQRCTRPTAADATVATLLLARLALAGPDPAGHALLRALEALHPDAFAPFPALLSAGTLRPCLKRNGANP